MSFFLGVKKHAKEILLIVSIVFFIGLSLATYTINFWPSDSYNPYIPTAAKLFELPFLSSMHQVPIDQRLTLVMHGKEALILGIAHMQKLLGDTQTLYPNTLLLIIAVFVSIWLLYAILKKIFNKSIGLLGSFIFMTWFWPYTYVLLGAHQPLALMNFLLSVFFLQRACCTQSITGYGYSLLSGCCLGLMLFSSPTATLYLPYYLGFAWYCWRMPYRKDHYLPQEEKPACGQHIDNATIMSRKNSRAKTFLLVIPGLISVFLWFTAPDPIESLKQFFKFLNFSQKGNNFVIYKDWLTQYFPLPPSLRGGGWMWTMRYCWMSMPIVFLTYLGCLLYLMAIAINKKNLNIMLIILISLSTPIGVELSGVAQFGRNYFSWIIGLLFVICFALDRIHREIQKASVYQQRIFKASVIILLTAHFVFNTGTFFTDIFPNKMATNHIYRWLINHRTNVIYTYRQHPLNKNFVQFFNNPKYKTSVYFWPIDSIKEAKSGYILIPPLTGKTILEECRREDFKDDPELTKLFLSKDFSKYTVAQFKTIASSRQWNQEEEICTYRDLMVHQITNADRQKGFAWILDATKLQKEWFNVQ